MSGVPLFEVHGPGGSAVDARIPPNSTGHPLRSLGRRPEANQRPAKCLLTALIYSFNHRPSPSVKFTCAHYSFSEPHSVIWSAERLRLY